VSKKPQRSESHKRLAKPSFRRLVFENYKNGKCISTRLTFKMTISKWDDEEEEGYNTSHNAERLVGGYSTGYRPKKA